MNLNLLSLTVSLALGSAPAPVEVLWPDGAPGAKGTEDADKPALTVYLPPADKANGAAVVVCPGGGYAHSRTATRAGSRPCGSRTTALPPSCCVTGSPRAYRHPRADAGRATGHPHRPRRAPRNGMSTRKKLACGVFRRAGNLASTAATHFDAGNPDATDPVERVSCRPDFAILCYPVITFLPPYAHTGSRDNLLGPRADEKLVREPVQ